MKTIITIIISFFTLYCIAGDESKWKFNGEQPKLKFKKYKYQEEDKPSQIGLRIGWQMSNLYKGGDKGRKELNFGYIGFMKQIGSGIFRTETGLEYMMAGSKFTDSSELQLNYIVVPLQGQIKLGPFLGLVGINANFMISDKYEVRSKEVKLNHDNEINWFDVTVDGGLGFNLFFLAIEARYYWGLIQLNDNAASPFKGYKNQFLQVGLKFHF